MFVGNLSWSTTDEQLMSFAAAAGSVVSAKVQLHADSQRSKGWGLVEFSTPDEATAAVAQLDSSECEGRVVHVRMDRSEIDTSTGFSVFIGNLPWSTTSASLQDIFAPYEPFDVHVKTNMSGRSRGFAIARFSSPEQAKSAISDMNGYLLEGRSIQVREDRPSPTEAAEGEGEGAKEVRETRPASGRRGRGGRGRRGRRGRGRGGRGGAGRGVGAETQQPVEVEEPPVKEPRKRQPRAPREPKEPKEPAAPSNSLFVGNLAWSVTDEQLLLHFQSSGSPVRADVQMSATGRSKGWGLVEYETAELAQVAIDTLNKTELGGRQINVRMNRK